MKKFLQNKITIIIGCVILVLLIGVIIWARKGCSEKEPEDVFSEDGIKIEDMADDIVDDETDDDETKDITQGNAVTAPDNWESGDTTDSATENNKKPEKQPEKEKEENEAETTGGFGKLF